MAYLSYPSPTEVQLQLDAQDGAILAVVRGCSWWTKAEVEGRLSGSTLVTGVTLTTTREMDALLRRILRMSFGLEFPQAGGIGHHPMRVRRSMVHDKQPSSQ
jgi:hypothetical protein